MESEKHMNKRYKILLVLIICIPGFYINGELINFIDIFLPIIMLSEVRRLRLNIKKNVINLSLICYIALCLLSIYIACIMSGTIYISALLKWFRLFLTLIVIRIVRTEERKNACNDEKFFHLLLSAGIFSALLGVVLFLTQSSIYQTSQTMLFEGKKLYRAGGIFLDAGTFSLMMVMIFAVAFEMILKRKLLKTAYCALIISSIAIIVSDNRTAILTILVLGVVRLFDVSKINYRKMVLILLLVSVIVIAYMGNAYVRRLVDERLLPVIIAIISGNSDIINTVSSQRTILWKNRLSSIVHNGIETILFGTGYKIGMEAISDNSFISCLATTGVFSFLALMVLWMSIGFKIKKIEKNNMFRIIAFDYSIIYFIYMFTSDAMTMIRPLYLYFLILAIAHVF